MEDGDDGEMDERSWDGWEGRDIRVPGPAVSRRLWGLVGLGLMLEFGPRRECGGAPKEGFSLASAWHRSHAHGAAVGVEAGREVDVTLALLWRASTRTPKKRAGLSPCYKRALHSNNNRCCPKQTSALFGCGAGNAPTPRYMQIPLRVAASSCIVCPLQLNHFFGSPPPITKRQIRQKCITRAHFPVDCVLHHFCQICSKPLLL